MGVKLGVNVEVKLDNTFIYNVVAKCIVLFNPNRSFGFKKSEGLKDTRRGHKPPH
jgi:hypothetical protein